MSTLFKSIWVKFQKEGIHCYPEAGKIEQLNDVSFLQYPHRHIFHFSVEVPVTHSNRDIEFIQFKRFCENLYKGTLELNYKSCEMIAEELIEKINEKYSLQWIKVSVSEDNENGANVFWTNNSGL